MNGGGKAKGSFGRFVCSAELLLFVPLLAASDPTLLVAPSEESVVKKTSLFDQFAWRGWVEKVSRVKRT